MQHKI